MQRSNAYLRIKAKICYNLYMSNIVVRNATIKDAKDIATVHVLSWQSTYRGLMPDEMLDSLTIEGRTKRWTKMLEEPNPESTVIVAEQNNKIVGWASFGKNRDEDVDRITGELWAIYAHPNSLGIGIGSLLMEYATKEMKQQGYKKATLWVLTTNKKTRKWYEKKGWENEGKIKLDKRGDHELHETRYQKKNI